MKRAFLFGKLPAHGDFVVRGMDANAREAIDGWLSRSLIDAREWHRAAFDALYDQAPPWRFAWRDGDDWTGGAIAPSIDAAGRRFPLFAGCAGLTEAGAGSLAEASEALLYRALAEGLDADATVSALETADDAVAADAAQAGWWTLGTAAGADSLGFPPAHVAEARPTALVRLMLTAEAS